MSEQARTDTEDGVMWQGARTMYLVKRLEMQLRARMEPIVKSVGLTLPQYTALTILQAQPGTSSAQLARNTFVSAQAANQIVEGLYARGLIRREPNPTHGKILSLTLTPEGERILASCASSIAHLEQRMLSTLETATAREFHESIRACIDALAE